MKLKYIIPSFMAVIAAVFTSCSENNDPTLLDSIQVSTSYLGIGQDGGKVSTILTANSDWAFANQKWIMGKDTITAATPQWLTVNQVSGPAGKTELTFSADKADESRECEPPVHKEQVNERENGSCHSRGNIADVVSYEYLDLFRVVRQYLFQPALCR